MSNLNKINRVGTVNYNTYNSEMEVTHYRGANDIIVKFKDNGNSVHTTWNNFKKGTVRNPYDKSLCGIAYVGQGNYTSSDDFLYKKWASMINRVYGNKIQINYKDCSVSEEWLNYQNFAEWLYNYQHEYHEVDESYHLDKDILIPKNKIYSKDNCVVVPSEINIFFARLKARANNFNIKSIKKEAKSLSEKYDGIIDERVITIMKNFKIQNYL